MTPKIGDKVSMLGNVRETLTKRFQLAKAAKIEARRRLMIIEYIRKLRNFIQNEINFKPKAGMENAKHVCLEKISYTEPTLVNENLWNLLH